MRAVFIEGDPEHRNPGAEKAAALAGNIAASLPAAVEALLLAPAPHSLYPHL